MELLALRCLSEADLGLGHRQEPTPPVSRMRPTDAGRASYAASGCGSMPTVALTGERPAGNPERGQSAEPDDHGADEHRRVHPVHECLSAGIAAHVGEHRRQHGDAEHAAQLADGVVGTDALPSSSRRTADSTTFADGAKNSAIPTPATTKGAHQARVRRVVGVETSAIHASAAA